MQQIPRIKTGSIVYWLDPARDRDGNDCCRQYVVTERKPGMLLLDDRIEALHKECYLRSEYCCPVCGKPLYYEKCYNTKDHYHLVCFNCDENFFICECDKDLSYGHMAFLSNLFNKTFAIVGFDGDEYGRDDFYEQSLNQFLIDWREGNIEEASEFASMYPSEHLKLRD